MIRLLKIDIFTQYANYNKLSLFKAVTKSKDRLIKCTQRYSNSFNVSVWFKYPEHLKVSACLDSTVTQELLVRSTPADARYSFISFCTFIPCLRRTMAENSVRN